jgi:hypothetical protein
VIRPSTASAGFETSFSNVYPAKGIMNCVCLCVKVQIFTFSGCRDKKILGHGRVWNGGRSFGQTSEPTKGERDWYPSFYLLRLRKMSGAAFFYFS